MRGLRRALAVAAASLLALAGCGGLGVNLRGNSQTANQVAITAVSGTTLNPYPVLFGHTVVLVAHPSAGNIINYGIQEPVRWDSSNPGVAALLENNCITPYGGEYTTTICIFGKSPGKSNIDGTTSNGAIGTLGISVTL